jgi:excisionase family DNA binding protein
MGLDDTQLEPLLNVQDAADYLSVPAGTVLKLCRTGKLECIRVHRTALRFTPGMLARFLEKQTTRVPEIDRAPRDAIPSRVRIEAKRGKKSQCATKAAMKEEARSWQ